MRILIDEKKKAPVAGTQGGRRPSGVPATGFVPEVPPLAPPDPEVSERPVRRQFSAQYKLRILEEADRCTEPGETGALLRREGLYSSNLSAWRRSRMDGTLGALTPKRRGPKPDKKAHAQEIVRLERKVKRLEDQLAQAHIIIDVQKKVSGLLGIGIETREPEEGTS